MVHMLCVLWEEPRPNGHAESRCWTGCQDEALRQHWGQVCDPQAIELRASCIGWQPMTTDFVVALGALPNYTHEPHVECPKTHAGGQVRHSTHSAPEINFWCFARPALE